MRTKRHAFMKSIWRIQDMFSSMSGEKTICNASTKLYIQESTGRKQEIAYK